MRLPAGQLVDRFAPLRWEPDVAALLDLEHLAAWSRDRRPRSELVSGLQRFLAGQPGVEVCPIFGRHVTSLDALCEQLELTLPFGPIARRIDGTEGIVAALRSRSSGPYAVRTRYLLWSEADRLLEAAPESFAAVADAIAGVSAEAEYVSEDALLVQRCVYVGGPALAEYARDPSGAFRAWQPPAGAPAGRRDGVVPFWRLVTGLESPPVRVAAVEGLLAGAAV